MMRKIKFLLVMASAAFFAAQASYAAVENVKLSGDITTRGLYRSNLSLRGIDGYP